MFFLHLAWISVILHIHALRESIYIRALNALTEEID